MLARLASNLMQSLMPTSRQMVASSDRGPDADFWYSSVMGLPNLAGFVDGNNAWMFVSTSFAATRVLSGIGATMPLELKQISESKGRMSSTVLWKDQRYRLLNERPNPIMSATAFRSLLITWQINRGTAFAEIQRDFDGETPVRLWPIHPSRCTPFINEKTGELWWRVSNKGAEPTDIPDRNMLRIPYILMDDDGIHGLGVGDLASRSIGLGQTLEKTEQDASSTALPRMVVESPTGMSMPEQDAFRFQWSKLFSPGSDNVPALLVGGKKAVPLNWSATDTDHRGRREFNIEDLARWYDVPLTLLRRMVKESAGNVEQLSSEFQKFSLKFLEMWEPECKEKLLTQAQRDSGMVFENDYKSLLKADHVARAAYWTNRFSTASITPNQIREAEGENPSDTKNADSEFIQGAFRPLAEPYQTSGGDSGMAKGNPKDGKRDPTAPPKAAQAIRSARNAVRTMLSETLSRMTSKEMKRAKVDASQPRTFIPKLEEFYGEHKKHLSEAISVVCSAGNDLKMKLDPDRIAGEWCGKSLKLLVDASGCSVGELPDAVALCVTDWNTTRVSEFVATITPKNKRAEPCRL